MFFIEVLGEFEERAAAAIDVAIGCFLVAAEDFAPVRFAEVAGFNIQKDLHFPRLESIPLDFPAQDFLHEAIELVKPGFEFEDRLLHKIQPQF